MNIIELFIYCSVLDALKNNNSLNQRFNNAAVKFLSVVNFLEKKDGYKKYPQVGNA